VVREFQKDYARQLLQTSQGVISEAASLAELDRGVFSQILERLGMVEEARTIRAAYTEDRKITQKETREAFTEPEAQPELTIEEITYDEETFVDETTAGEGDSETA